MKATNFDALLASVPANRDAAFAVSQKGEHYEPRVGDTRRHYETPPPTTEPPANTTRDMRGHRCGWLTVVGYLGPGRKAIGARWLVRCVCGRYEERSRKALTNPTNMIVDRCTRCQRERALKKRAYFERTGKWPEDEA